MTSEILDKTAALLTAAFGLVAALAWNKAISEWVEGLGISGGPWIYAVLVTILGVVATVLIARAAAKAKGQVAKECRF